jgi:hypothetical protein
VDFEMKMSLKNHRTLLTLCVLVCAAILFFLIKPDVPRQNEVIERARTVSPSGTWIAKTALEITSAPLVSAASYEVRVMRASDSGADKEFIIYSVEASGPTNITTEWKVDDILIVSDIAENISKAYKAQRPGIKVQFVSVPL